MSWRRFLALAGNLSPYGAVASRIRAMGDKGKDTEDKEENRRASERFFSSVVSV